MSKSATEPMPLDATPRYGRRAGKGPLRWLRARLFPQPKSRASEPSTLAGFPPPVGRGQALRKAHSALLRLFEKQEGLRQVLPHLSLLEQALARKGSKALRRLAVLVLERSLEQLEELQAGENHPDMAVLRNRIIEELALRSVAAPVDPGPTAPLSTIGLEVRDTTTSVFDEVQRSWTTSMPSNSQH